MTSVITEWYFQRWYIITTAGGFQETLGTSNFRSIYRGRQQSRQGSAALGNTFPVIRTPRSFRLLLLRKTVLKIWDDHLSSSRKSLRGSCRAGGAIWEKYLFPVDLIHQVSILWFMVTRKSFCSAWHGKCMHFIFSSSSNMPVAKSIICKCIHLSANQPKYDLSEYGTAGIVYFKY